MTTIRIDYENNAETFWDEFGAQFPSLCARLLRDGQITISRKIYRRIAALPGFDCGPNHAPTPFLESGERAGKVLRRA